MLADTSLIVAIASERLRMLRADHQERSGRKNNIVVTQTSQRADEVPEYVIARFASVGKNILGRRTTDHRHCAVGCIKAALYMQRFPWTLAFILGDAKREFSGMTVGGRIGFSRRYRRRHCAVSVAMPGLSWHWRGNLDRTRCPVH